MTVRLHEFVLQQQEGAIRARDPRGAEQEHEDHLQAVASQRPDGRLGRRGRLLALDMQEDDGRNIIS
jgi:hypothetical protein